MRSVQLHLWFWLSDICSKVAVSSKPVPTLRRRNSEYHYGLPCTSVIILHHYMCRFCICGRVQEVMNDYRSTMTHSDIMLSGDLSANIIWLETFIKTLDNMDAHLHRLLTRSSLSPFRVAFLYQTFVSRLTAHGFPFCRLTFLKRMSRMA